jgi:hypothetical protein
MQQQQQPQPQQQQQQFSQISQNQQKIRNNVVQNESESESEKEREERVRSVVVDATSFPSLSSFNLHTSTLQIKKDHNNSSLSMGTHTEKTLHISCAHSTQHNIKKHKKRKKQEMNNISHKKQHCLQSVK